ncbi:MAG: vWA domain-containing protein [bacterium]
MTMRRRQVNADSLELLLDTICNVFGGLILIAILVVLQTQFVADKLHEPAQAATDTDPSDLQLAVVSLQERIASLKLEAAETQEEYDRMASPAKRRLLEAREKLVAKLEDWQARSTEVDARLYRASSELESAEEGAVSQEKRVAAAERRVRARTRAAAATPEQPSEDVRLPHRRGRATGRAHYLLVYSNRVCELKRPAGNHVIVLDASGSMASSDWRPTRLAGAQEAARALVRRLAQRSPDAKVGVVVYSGRATVLCKLTPVRRPSPILAAIRRISTGGSTNIGAGLEAAHSLLQGTSGPSRIVLLTDGRHTAGPEPTLVAGAIKPRGTIDCIGIGRRSEVNERMLRMIASQDRGGQPRYRWIGERVQLVRHFQKLATSLIVSARPEAGTAWTWGHCLVRPVSGDTERVCVRPRPEKGYDVVGGVRASRPLVQKIESWSPAESYVVLLVWDDSTSYRVFQQLKEMITERGYRYVVLPKRSDGRWMVLEPVSLHMPE